MVGLIGWKKRVSTRRGGREEEEGEGSAKRTTEQVAYKTRLGGKRVGWL